VPVIRAFVALQKVARLNPTIFHESFCGALARLSSVSSSFKINLEYVVLLGVLYSELNNMRRRQELLIDTLLYSS